MMSASPPCSNRQGCARWAHTRRRVEFPPRLAAARGEPLDPSHILETASLELFRAVPCSGVSTVLFDAGNDPHLVSEYPPVSADLPRLIPQAPLFERLRPSLGIFYTE